VVAERFQFVDPELLNLNRVGLRRYPYDWSYLGGPQSAITPISAAISLGCSSRRAQRQESGNCAAEIMDEMLARLVAIFE